MAVNFPLVELVFDVDGNDQVEISIELPDTALVRLQALVAAPALASTSVPAVIPVAAEAVTASPATALAPLEIEPKPTTSMRVTITALAPVIMPTPVVATLAAPTRRGILGILIPAALIGLGLWLAVENCIARCCR